MISMRVCEESVGTPILDSLLANYWRRGQGESLTRVTWLMRVISSQLRALRLLYLHAVQVTGPVPDLVSGRVPL